MSLILGELGGSFVPDSVADLEVVRVVRLNPPLGPNHFNFIEKFMKNEVKC